MSDEERRARRREGMDRIVAIGMEQRDEDDMDVVTCQGCGAVRGMTWLNKPHACHRNEDGTYEEGGTFQ